MATIKAYTDLEQSKVLATILPIESADMWWLYVTAQGKHIAMMYEEPDPHYLARMESYGIKDAAIRCWSLAALLDVLPKNLNIGRPSLNSNYKGYYWIQYYDEFMKPNDYKTECFNNPVDACVNMILKLHELNLL